MFILIFSVLTSYLLGSIPFGYLLAKLLKGIDIRTVGSGNIGATNVARAVGKGWGITVLILDALKGLFAVLWLADFTLRWPVPIEAITFRILLGIAVVCGHNWTVFLGFKGGKGMSTSLGVLVGLAIAIPVLRPVLLISVLVWIGLFLATNYVSLSSLVSVFLAPFLMLVFGAPGQIVIFGSILAVFVFIRHKSNISRLLKGTEHKILIFKK
jgi:glycerol-3-phosphate acyltransferase PlsY